MAENKYYRLSYELFAHDKEGGTPILVEKTSADHPFEFITGLGYTLPDFEQEVSQLHKRIKHLEPPLPPAFS